MRVKVEAIRFPETCRVRPRRIDRNQESALPGAAGAYMTGLEGIATSGGGAGRMMPMLTLTPARPGAAVAARISIENRRKVGARPIAGELLPSCPLLRRTWAPFGRKTARRPPIA